MNDVTRILRAIEGGNPSAAGDLLPLVYEELRKLAAQRIANEKPGQTLQATALVHEAYLRLVDVDASRRQQWNGRGHFFAAAAEAMRRILVEAARRKQSLKAGGDRRRMDVEGVDAVVPTGAAAVDLLALDEALVALAREKPRKVEVVKLRFFAGLTNDQAAEVLGISSATAENDWAYARAWLRLRLEGESWLE